MNKVILLSAFLITGIIGFSGPFDSNQTEFNSLQELRRVTASMELSKNKAELKEFLVTLSRAVHNGGQKASCFFVIATEAGGGKLTLAASADLSGGGGIIVTSNGVMLKITRNDGPNRTTKLTGLLSVPGGSGEFDQDVSLSSSEILEIYTITVSGVKYDLMTVGGAP